MSKYSQLLHSLLDVAEYSASYYMRVFAKQINVSNSSSRIDISKLSQRVADVFYNLTSTPYSFHCKLRTPQDLEIELRAKVRPCKDLAGLFHSQTLSHYKLGPKRLLAIGTWNLCMAALVTPN